MDVALPWEARKTITLTILAEAAAQGTKWTSTLGPTSLRRTAGPGMNPVSALFMTEVARTSTLTPAQLTANGRTVTVDLNRIDEEDDVEHLPVRALSVNDATSRRSGNYSASSQFLPNRPDDVASPSGYSAQSSAQAAVTAKTGSSIARPDLLINGSATAKNIGAAGNGRPQSAAVKSSAATLLSAGKNSPADVNSPGDKRMSMPMGRAPSSTPEKPMGAVAAEDTDKQAPKRLLNKMASFFQR